MTELEKIYKTLSKPSDKWQPYFEVYEKHIMPLKKRELTLVEVGVQEGGSLEMWSKYLGSKSTIIGIDVDPKCSDLEYTQKNVEVIIGNQEDPKFWDAFLKETPTIDIFIDDGGHGMRQQIVTFEKVFPNMPVGSVYICEDTHTSYYPGYRGGVSRPGTFIEYAKSCIDAMHFDWTIKNNQLLAYRAHLTKDLTNIIFYDSMVVFEKFGKRSMERVQPGV